MSSFIGGPPAAPPGPGELTCERMIWKPISDPDHPLLAAREAPCGAVATTERGQARCWRCRSTEDDNAFGTDRPSNLEEIRRQHHIPAEAYATWIRVPGETFDEPQWHVDHVRIQMFTLPVEPGVSFIPLRFPWAFAPLPVINRPGIVARWRLRHVGKPGVLDMMWDYGRKDLEWRTRGLPPEAKADQDHLIALLYTRPITLRRRRCLQESPTSPWRHFAERGVEMLHADSTLSVRGAAVRLRMVDYERPRRRGARPRTEGDAERAAERRLLRWIRLLEKVRRSEEAGGQTE